MAFTLTAKNLVAGYLKNLQKNIQRELEKYLIILFLLIKNKTVLIW